MSVPVLRKHTDALIATLEAAISGGNFTVGDAEAENAPPTMVVYDIPGGRSYGTVAAPNEDADLVYQVTCVGETREQAEWLADKAISTLLAGFTVTDRSIAQVDIDSFPGVRRDDTVSPNIFIATPRFRVTTTPS